MPRKKKTEEGTEEKRSLGKSIGRSFLIGAAKVGAGSAVGGTIGAAGGAFGKTGKNVSRLAFLGAGMATDALVDDGNTVAKEAANAAIYVSAGTYAMEKAEQGVQAMIAARRAKRLEEARTVAREEQQAADGTQQTQTQTLKAS